MPNEEELGELMDDQEEQEAIAEQELQIAKEMSDKSTPDSEDEDKMLEKALEEEENDKGTSLFNFQISSKTDLKQRKQ